MSEIECRRVFDACLMVDWSSRANRAPLRPSNDAIWYCWRQGFQEQIGYCRTRQQAESEISELLSRPLRILAGFDFAFCYPRWFLETLGVDWSGMWTRLEDLIVDGPDFNNRFDVAATLNREASGYAYPFWGTRNPTNFLSATRPFYHHPELRSAELAVRGTPSSPFKLFTAGAVGGQTLLGLPFLNRLRRRFGDELCVWPFEPPARRIVLAEIYPSLLPSERDTIRDRAQVRACARFFSTAPASILDCPPEYSQEGWILGATLLATR